MGDDSVNIDNIKGKVNGVSYGSTGSLSAEVINIQGNLTIVVNNATPEVVEGLRKFNKLQLKLLKPKIKSKHRR
jgi:hypothetical protein